MSKNKYKKSFGNQSKSAAAQSSQAVPPKAPTTTKAVVNSSETVVSNSQEKYKLLLEQMSLNAYQHIQKYLNSKNALSKEEVTAILRLSQHLRVFGLLSAVGYLNQTKEGKVQERIEPVWKSLLGQLIEPNNPPEKKQLMQKVEEMARQNPSNYMATWRKALALSKHWNFWARAHQQGE